jgi:hypothetical protein
MWNKLNIYNIPNAIVQKNFVTDIQNDLYTIYTNKTYKEIKQCLNYFFNVLLNHVNVKLENNEENNYYITHKIINDVVYENIFNNLKNRFPTDVTNENENNIKNSSGKFEQSKQAIYDCLYFIVTFFVKKNVSKFVTDLVNDIDYIINSFDKKSKLCEPFGFGSTSSVYCCTDPLTREIHIEKWYNSELRWKTNDHDNISEIFKKEVKILKMIESKIQIGNSVIIMPYYGRSLYELFELPDGWEKMIKNIFEKLTQKNIYYPEFNLHNILVKQDEINFVDYGLAKIMEKNDESNTDINKENCEVFIKLLSILNGKLVDMDITEQHIYYNTFVNQLKSNKKYEKNIF